MNIENYNMLNDLNNLNYTFNINERFIHVKDDNGCYFKSNTPFLKILKPVHITLNKKKTIAKKYLILETNDDLDFNNQVGEFMFIINKIHEISQEKIRLHSMSWFNTEFDSIGLDIKVRKPVDQHKDSEFIKITLPNSIENEVNNLKKGDYILCNIIFKGLKISSDYIMEEWELESFTTQEDYDKMQNEDFLVNSIVNVDDTILENYLENDLEVDIKNDLDDFKDDLEVDIKNDLEVDLENIVNNQEIIKPKKIKKSYSSKIKENKLNKEYKNNEVIKKLSKKLIFT